MSTGANAKSDRLAGTARLPVVVPVAVLSFFYTNLLDYALPLYFGARTEAAKTQDGEFPLGVWSALVK